MEDTIKIELLTPLTGNFTSRELERQWEEGEYEYDVYEGLPLEGTDLSQYESEIKEAIEKYNAIGNEEGKPCNLMDYFDGSAAIKESDQCNPFSETKRGCFVWMYYFGIDYIFRTAGNRRTV